MRMLKSVKANLSAGKMVGLFIALIIVSALVATVIQTISATSGNFTGVAKTLWDLLPFAIVLAIFLGVLAVAGYKMSMR